jgi:hypothetical protein
MEKYSNNFFQMLIICTVYGLGELIRKIYAKQGLFCLLHTNQIGIAFSLKFTLMIRIFP